MDRFRKGGKLIDGRCHFSDCFPLRRFVPQALDTFISRHLFPDAFREGNPLNSDDGNGNGIEGNGKEMDSSVEDVHKKKRQ